MKIDRPMIFSGDMVRAIIDGRKTQTRRIVKSQHKPVMPFNPIVTGTGTREDRTPWLIWVRETWSVPEMFDSLKPSEIDPRCVHSIRYHADGIKAGKTRPSIFMPRWASRITLEVTDIQSDNLQNISFEDSEKEGFKNTWEFCLKWQKLHGVGSWNENPVVWVISFEVAV
jgi:hypothetical protein